MLHFCFLHLDTKIRPLETVQNMNAHGKDLYSFILKSRSNNVELRNLWNVQFKENQDTFMDSSISNCLEEVLKKVCKHVISTISERAQNEI